MELKVIKTEEEHERALSALMALMEADPPAGSAEADRLEVLATLIEKYEDERFPIDVPDPVAAIRFRMEQAGLTQKDLIPYLGAASRVSEVLSGKRPLSLSMIRRLSEGLGIPPKVLISEPGRSTASTRELAGLDWQKFPVKAMCDNGYFGRRHISTRALAERAEELVRGFLAGIAGPVIREPALLRTTVHRRESGKQMDMFALLAWQARVIENAEAEPLESPYVADTVDRDFLKRLAQESWSEQGPLRAREFLNHHGIHLITEPHLPKTYLDGAAFENGEGRPIIALTLRYDRIDHFWFTLIHELAHVALHFDGERRWFVDDLEAITELDALEREADDLASESMIPSNVWKNAELATGDDVRALANELGIHPAIVAGRARRETGDYRTFAKLVGHGEVREQF